MRYLQKAVDIDPTRAEYHLYLAWGATESQDWKLGETEVGKALASDQMLGDAYWQRAVIEEVKGNVEDAIRDATKALELRPGRNEAHATLAKCYADKNRPDLALNEWATATAREADRPDWEYLYGRLLHEQGKYGQALPHVVLAAKASEAMNPAPPWATHAEFLAADGLRRAGNKVDAKEHYHRYLDKGERSSPDYRDAQAALHAIDPTYVVQ
jgi:Tfp pilus assembly protein PilF